MESKIATDLEQSKKLLELGIDADTADMHWESISDDDHRLGLFTAKETKESLERMQYTLKTTFNVKLSPAWSLSALMNLLPSELSLPDMYGGTIKYEIRIRKYSHTNELYLYQIAYATNQGLSKSWHDMVNTSEQEDLLDTVFEMIVYLKENKLI